MKTKRIEKYINLKRYIFFPLMLFICLFFFTGCSEEQVTLYDKAKSELDYFNVKFINILNRLNNITFENYTTSAIKVDLSGKNSENNKEESSNGVASVEGTGKETTQITAMQMSPNTILNPVTNIIDWKEIKNEIESIYSSWNTVLLDLYDLNVTNEDILGFSKDLDIATTYIKKEDKENSILAVVNLYKYLAKYAEQISDDLLYINIYKTKAYVLNAFSFVGIGKWDLALNEINNSIESFKLISNNTNYIGSDTYRINKVYVMLNELSNSMELNDTSIFYIKYRNLMEELIQF